MKIDMDLEDFEKIPKISAYEQLGDFYGSLKYLKETVEKLIAEHGEESIVIFDAGHNNVDCEIVTQKSIADKKEELNKIEQASLATQEKDEKTHLEFLNYRSKNGENLEDFTKKELKTYKKLTQKYA